MAPSHRLVDRTNRSKPAQYSGYSIQRYQGTSRFWGLYDPEGELVCVTVYKKGAEEVARRLQNASVEVHRISGP